MSLLRAAALLLCVLALGGCSSIHLARQDGTALEGDVRTDLGRTVAVEWKGGDEETRASLLSALEREFVGKDLFDAVIPAGPAVAGTTVLRIEFLRTEAEDLYDYFEFQDAYAARFELDVQMANTAGDTVIKGRVDGIGVDDVSDDEFVDDPKQTDIRLAAMNDAVMKISRSLRREANERATKALLELPEIGLPAGVAPLEIAVLGFDDVSGASRRRGAVVTERLAEALVRLGREFKVTPHPEARRAVNQEPPEKFFGIKDYEVALVARHVPTRVYVVGQVKASGGVVEATARLVTREGEEVLTVDATENGLGALPVVAVRLAEKLGKALQTTELPEKGEK